MTPVGFAYLASALATGTGAAVAYRSRAHLPIALLLGFGLGADAIIRACGPDPFGWRFALSLSLGSAYPWAVLGVVGVSLRGAGRLGKERTRSHVGGGPPLRRGVGAQAAPGPTEGVAQDGGGVGDCASGVNEDPGDEVRGDDAEQAHREPPGGADSHGAVASVGGMVAGWRGLYTAVSRHLGSRCHHGHTALVASCSLPPASHDSSASAGAKSASSPPHAGQSSQASQSFLRRSTTREESFMAWIQAWTMPIALPLLFTLYLASLLSSGVRGPALARCYAVAQTGLGLGMAWMVRGWERRRKQLGGPSVSSGDESESTERHRDGSGVPRTHHRAPSASASQARAEHATRRAPTATEIAAVICAAAEIANIPALLGLPGWTSARSVYAVAYLALIFVHVRALIGGPPCRPLTPYTSGGPRS